MIRSSSTKKRVTVCVIAAHPMVLAQLQRILNAAPLYVDAQKLTVVAADSVQVPKATVYMLDAASCLEGPVTHVAQLLQQEPGANVLVLGERFDDATAFELLNLGVKGLVTHENMAQQLPRALETISSGGLWVWRKVLSKFVDALVGASRTQDTVHQPDVRMSQRERQIANGLLKNLTNKEIANELNISERTVKFHVSNLLSKFKVQRRSDLLVLWYGQAPASYDPRFSN
ncbi:MAG TPA: response regulator transcription factor [Terriglobales bacterium]|nr:response regulator transcription factor [Terriglobales bacterium]